MTDKAQNRINRVVVAGAGSGKTTWLIGEIIFLVTKERIPLEKIAAITFTEAAAAEIKERLRVEIMRLVAEDPDGGWNDALISLEQAQISTIHALAARILRENPLEAGIDPNFSVTDDTEGRILDDVIWDDWTNRAFAGGGAFDEDIVTLIKYLGVSGMKRFAETLSKRPDKLEQYWDHRSESARDDAERQRLDALHSRINELSALLPDADEDDILLNHCRTLCDILNHENLEEIWDAFSEVSIQKRGGSKKKWRNEETLSEAKRLRSEVIDEIKEIPAFLTLLDEDILVGLGVTVLSDYVAHRAAERNRRGTLTYFDLLYRAYLLVRDNKAVRKRYQRLFECILVDEFQDTDPIQTKLILFLAEKSPEAERPEDAMPGPGRLFIVGDPQQSIYSFTDADIGLFYKTMDRIIASGGEVERLQTNYRSQRHLVSFQNIFFDEFIRYEEASYSVGYQVMHSYHDDVEDSTPPLVEVVVSDPGGGNNTEEVRRLEAAYIARRIQEFVALKTDGACIRDKGTGTTRPPGYGDIAILLRSLVNTSAVYEEALKAENIPYYILGGRGYYQRQEIYDLSHILAAAQDPTDRRALVSTLRSPVFGVDDRTIFELKTLDMFDYLAHDPPDPAGEAFRILRELNRIRGERFVSGLIDEVYSLTDMLEIHAFGPGGPQRVGNLLKIQRIAREREAEGRLTLPDFIKTLSLLAESDKEEGEETVADEGQDAVRIMTVHKAKGLEFPIVILPNLGRGIDYRANDGVYLIEEDTGVRAGIRTGHIKDMTYETYIKGRYRERNESEEKRLLYVAATRARDRLILIGSPKSNSGHMKKIIEFCSANESEKDIPIRLTELSDDGKGGASARIRAPQTGEYLEGSADASFLDETRRREAARTEEMRDAREKRVFISVTERKSRREPDEELFDASFLSDEANGSDRARLVGVVVHDALEFARFDGTDDPEQLTARAIGFLDDADPDYHAVYEESKRLVEGFIASPLYREISGGTILGKEVPLISTDDDRVLSGRIDLCYRTDEGIVVLDYKTDRIESEDAENAARRRYRDQIAAYIDAVIRSGAHGGSPVIGVVHFIRTGQSVRVDPP